MTTLTTDESLLYGMSREELATHGRAAQQLADAADRSLGDFAVCVLMLPPGSPRTLVMAEAGRRHLVDRCRAILAAADEADLVMRAYEQTLLRRGLARADHFRSS